METFTDKQARYWARKAGLRRIKARGRQHWNQRGGYQLVNYWNCVVGGVDFDFSAERVVEFAQQELAAQGPPSLTTRMRALKATERLNSRRHCLVDAVTV
jgi:hypothetical protein